jgi:hypothetical protein
MNLSGIVCFGAVLLVSSAAAQTGSTLNIRLDLDFRSAEQTVELYEGRSGVPQEIISLRGSQMARATTELLAQRSIGTTDLRRSLEAVKFGHGIDDDVFGLTEGRKNSNEINELLSEIKRRNFGRRVVSTVEQFFPSGPQLTASIPVYFVAFGHENIGAFVRRVVWIGDTPVFTGEGEGEPTIVVNLARAVHYGRTVDEQFIGTLSVVAHEVFHSAFGVYKDDSPVWRRYYESHRGYLDQLLDLTQNEGIAHYLTFEQRTGGRLPVDWFHKVRASFEQFNEVADDLESEAMTPLRAGELIRQSNTSGYWESYGAITGLYIAREIDRELGRPALAETVAQGPADFYRKYVLTAARNGTLPALSLTILRRLGAEDSR